MIIRVKESRPERKADNLTKVYDVENVTASASHKATGLHSLIE
jgi:hypothetical protein